jgi:hypothetical protein
MSTTRTVQVKTSSIWIDIKTKYCALGHNPAVLLSSARDVFKFIEETHVKQPYLIPTGRDA